ncbi:hypothetical protein [Cellulomonas sp. KRMCY2]|uniref:hypothetical protein n=1 Tax=Cellulomonas sp. KRMCY2 TaxID=1304865 RepID=UPI00045E9B47|nr:hypothetical protein [Cellulomonas sp. KRMCY2]
MASSIRLRHAPHPSARVRRAVVGSITIGIALAVGGCSTTNPMSTTRSYAASDGVAVELGDLRIGNLLVLSAAEGGAGTVLAALSNDGTADIVVTIGLADGVAGSPIDVPAGQTVLVGPDAAATVDLDAVPVAPGALVDLTITSDQGGTATRRAPVLDGSQPEYAELVP